MSCQLIYNKQTGNVETVLAKNGNPSNLYSDLKSKAKDEKTALDLWLYSYTDTFKSKFGDWEAINELHKYIPNVQGVYKTLLEVSPQEALFEIAAQSQTKNNSTDKLIPKEIVDIANRMYPYAGTNPELSIKLDNNGEPTLTSFVSALKNKNLYTKQIVQNTSIEGLNQRLSDYGSAKVLLSSDFYEGKRPEGRLNAFKSSIEKVAENIIILTDLNLNEFDFISEQDKKRLDALKPIAEELRKINMNEISSADRRTVAVEKRYAHLTNQLANEFVDIVGKHVEQKLGKKITSSKPKTANQNQSYFQLNNKNLKEADEKLDKQLLEFLSQFGVTSKEINNFKERFGVDAIGATDIIQKLIYLSSRRNITTVPEEAAHMIVMLMGKDHPLIKEALTNIENWSGYSKVVKEYMPIYKNINKVKIEALGHLIRDAVVNEYTSENIKDESLFKKIKDVLQNIFDTIRSKFGIKQDDKIVYDKQAVVKIAQAMLAQDASLVNSQKSFSYSTNVNYNNALNNDPLAKQIVEEYTEKLPFKLTGSLAIAKQTNIQRWKGEQIHDIDFKISKEWLDKNGEQKLDEIFNKPNIVKLREIRSEYSSYYTRSYLQAPEGYRIEQKRDVINGSSPMMDINVYDENGNKLTVLESLEKVKSLDFFVGGDSLETSFENVASWQDIMNGKLSLSALGEEEVMFDRAKDQTDYINIIPVNLQESKEKNLYFQLPTETKEGVEELFDSNFAIFAESKTSDEVINKLLVNKVIDKKCS